jgi:hypothetical protein
MAEKMSGATKVINAGPGQPFTLECLLCSWWWITWNRHAACPECTKTNIVPWAGRIQ